MALGEYKKKRRFTKTPEPAGKRTASSKQLRFVVQKHAASRLHYDFRLELDGVLKSWAVPKGPSLNPSDKRLAMMVEDHPMDYRDFEGVIPEGNYGAGSVMVWDEGTYTDYEQSSDLKTAHKNLKAGLAKGDFKFQLNGKKLKGAYVLAKMRTNEDNTWLLIKKKDDFATIKDITSNDKSVKSGKTLAQIAKTDKKWLKEPKLDLKGTPKTKQPKHLEPMLATLTGEPFDRKDWLFEVKWDGYRILAHLEKGTVKLMSRNAKNYTEVFRPVASELANLKVDAILDGEIVVVDGQGKSDFGQLQNYQKTGKGELVYYIFDAPFAAGYDLRNWPLSKRKTIVLDLIDGLGDNVRYSDHIDEKGKAFFSEAQKAHLEGIIGKDSQSTYKSGKRAKTWLKIKTRHRQEVVIGGWTEPKGSRQKIGALTAGVYDGKNLVYVGHVGGGLDGKKIEDLYQQLRPLEHKTSPFSTKFKTNSPVHWVKPQLIAEVEFAEWTGDGHLRQPVFIGLRKDKDPQAIIREQPANDPPEKSDSKLELSNLNKVFWPKEGYSKGDVIDYYGKIADTILPYLVDRPESMNRHPNGIEGKSFYQKDVHHMPPSWVKTQKIWSESNQKEINYLLCQDKNSLLYMANLGCIELHPWHSRIPKLDHPDYCLIDLDAKSTGFETVIEVARETHKLLDELGVNSYPKTSGKTGLHICIPLEAKYSYEQSKQFAELIVQLVQDRLPKITSLERNPDKRKGKLYLDWLQNRKGQTMAAPYCLRPVPGATVSTPLKWTEVKKGLDPKKFNIKTIHQRLKKVGDLWQPVIGKGIDMQKVLTKLQG